MIGGRARVLGLAALVVGGLVAPLLVACGTGGPDCETPTDIAATVGERELTCGEAAGVADYVHVLAGRGPSEIERERVVRAVVERFRADPAGTEAWLDEIEAAGKALEALTGIEGAVKRASLVYEAAKGEGLVKPSDGAAFTVQESALAVWATDDERRIALTEMDIEGWLRYASLCREVQGAGPSRLSVADRVQAYRMVQDRFAHGGPEVQDALVAFGPYWGQIRDGWKMASYDRQQAWIAAAPLPPPMTATSLGYTEAILQGDVAAHARVLHERIGPFTMVKGRPAFE